MWRRKILKKKSKHLLKSNYWKIIAVCFLSAMLTTAYASSTTILDHYLSDDQIKTSDEASAAAGASNSEVIGDTVEQIGHTPSSSSFSSPVLNSATQFLIDMYTSGKSVFVSFLKVFNSIMIDPSYWFSVFLLLGAIVSLLYQFLIANIIFIGERRFFMEVRNYPQTNISKIFYLYKLRFIRNPAWIMCCRNILQWLWNLTIIGGIIKYYEYSMIPFILAENPAISRKNAFLLSRRLMHGNKWKLFMLNVSFAGWYFISFLTLGMFNFIFVNPYVTGTYTELYMELRKAYILSRSPGYDAFNDSPLHSVPSEDELLINKALYDDSLGPYTRISYFSPEQYPVFMYSIQPPEKAVRKPIQATQKYGVISTLFLVFAFSVCCWFSEGIIHLIRDGVLPNRGFSLGPWVLLYGLFGLILLIFIKRFSNHPILSFTMMFVTYSLIQYLPTFLINRQWKIEAITTTGFFINQDFSAALGGAVYFSMLGCAFLYYLAPLWNARFQKRPLHMRILMCILLSLFFIISIAKKGF